MQRKVNALLSLIMLVFFLPAILGFSLIDHHCTGCQAHDKETAFLITAHTHDEASCFCTEASSEGTTHNHSSSKHSHDCDVELKKLEVPFTPASFSNWLPTPLEISFADLFFADNQVLPESFSANSAPLLFSPPRFLSGYERLIRNEVFRL